MRAAFVLLAACAVALSCGRSELDWVGTDGLPAATGGAGTTGAAGTRGAGGTTGAAGTRGAGGTAGTRGAGGTTGTAGTRGAGGTTGTAGTGIGPILQIPCGGQTCTAGEQRCCINLMTTTATCLPADQPCPVGPSISCLDTVSCGPGHACCLSTSLPPSTTCESPLSCIAGAGLIICSSDRDCPGLGHCCGSATAKFCSPQACP